MSAHPQHHRDYGFVIGLLTGALAAAGLAMWLAPRLAAELRELMLVSARNLGNELNRKSQDVRDDAADRVARGAHEVERQATAARSDRVPEAKKHAAADRSRSKRHSL